MRIALVSMHTSPAAVPGSGDAGGMNVVVAAAAAALAARGHDVTVVTRASTGVAAGELAFPAAAGASGDCSTAGSTGSAPQPPPRLLALAAGPAALRKGELPDVIPEFAEGLRALGRFDAVHAHYWLSGVAARAAFGGMGPSTAVTFHTLASQKNARLAPGDAPEPEIRLAAERELAAESFVIAGSQSELGGVAAIAGSTPVGTAVVHPGVDTAMFRPRHASAAQAPAASARLRLTVLGRVQPLKGQDLVVRAAIALAQLDPALFARTEWVIAGEPTPGAEQYAAQLRGLAAHAGVAAHIRFLPAHGREQAAELLAASTLVLVPSHSETFGLTALEAAACGVPVVAAGHTGLLEAVPDGAGAVHMSDRNPDTWARVIARLLRDAPRRAQLGAAARAHAELHDWRTHAAELERCYERIAALPRTR